MNEIATSTKRHNSLENYCVIIQIKIIVNINEVTKFGRNSQIKSHDIQHKLLKLIKGRNSDDN